MVSRSCPRSSLSSPSPVRPRCVAPSSSYTYVSLRTRSFRRGAQRLARKRAGREGPTYERSDDPPARYKPFRRSASAPGLVEQPPHLATTSSLGHSTRSGRDFLLAPRCTLSTDFRPSRAWLHSSHPERRARQTAQRRQRADLAISSLLSDSSARLCASLLSETVIGSRVRVCGKGQARLSRGIDADCGQTFPQPNTALVRSAFRRPTSALLRSHTRLERRARRHRVPDRRRVPCACLDSRLEGVSLYELSDAVWSVATEAPLPSMRQHCMLRMLEQGASHLRRFRSQEGQADLAHSQYFLIPSNVLSTSCDPSAISTEPDRLARSCDTCYASLFLPSSPSTSTLSRSSRLLASRPTPADPEVAKLPPTIRVRNSASKGRAIGAWAAAGGGGGTWKGTWSKRRVGEVDWAGLRDEEGAGGQLVQVQVPARRSRARRESVVDKLRGLLARGDADAA